MSDFIVFAWFTPDYRHWADRLIANLTARAIPHDIVEVPKLLDSWEANTMAKPGHLLAAMDRHPDKTIILLDVDCTVQGDLTPLSRISGDVGFYANTRWHRRSGVIFKARSGTVIIRPTDAARRYVEAWAAASREAPWGDVDQSPQVVAMGRTPGAAFTMLDLEWCAMKDELPDAPIVHDGASRGTHKISRRQRRLGRWFGWFHHTMSRHAHMSP